MEIKGSVSDIIFRNAENGYSVLLVECENALVTAVGVFPMVVQGETLEMTGQWTENAKFGEQFNVEKVKIIQPSSAESLVKYLSSGLFYGVGEQTAVNIVAKYGSKTFDIIEKEPEKLSKVKNVSMKKAMSISETYKSLKDTQATLLYLQEYDVGLNLALKIYKTYEGATKRIIEKNPYQIVDDVRGVGFITADRIAKKMGIKSDSRFRVSAGISYVLSDIAGKNGHTYLPKALLCDEVSKLLEIDRLDSRELVLEIIDDNVVMGKIVIIPTPEDEAVMLSRSYLTEKSIAKKIMRMIGACHTIALDIDNDLAMYQKINGISLHEGQIVAIKNCISYGVNVITGGPGTGKTTIIKCIIDILKAQKMSVCLCAPTGRAAKRLSEATGEEAKTIHRMLDLDFTDGEGVFAYNEETRLDADIVIVDEVSMCDEYVFNALIGAIKTGGRLIMVGDKDQLPSVGAGNVLSDIIQSDCVPINYLTQIYRQGEDSTIVTNAHLINEGKMPIINNRSRDFFFDNQSSPSAILANTVSMISQRLPKFSGVNPMDIQVLCPMKKGLVGVENMNVVLQNALNPMTLGKAQIKIGGKEFRVGDKIIHLVNNYQLNWTNDNDNSVGTGIYNGDIGYIVGINASEPSLLVKFDDGKIVKYKSGDFEQISLAYAVSVHKSQGSEFDVVILAIAGGNYVVMTRNLLYTAVTRAKKTAVIIGEFDSLQKMVNNNYTAKRYSLLSQFIIEERNSLKRMVE